MSEIDIANRALSDIGARAQISSFDEASIEAQTCGLWYDKLRRQLLQAAPWGFARNQLYMSQLGTLSGGSSPFPYLYKYEYPSTCVNFRYVVTPPTYDISGTSNAYGSRLKPDRNSRFLVHLDVDAAGNGTRCILSNVQNAIGVFTYDVDNTDLFDDLFEGALTAALSNKLIIPLSGNIGMKDALTREVTNALNQAKASDANQAMPSTDHTPDWISARGIGSPYGYGPQWGEWYCGWNSTAWGE